MADRWFLIVQPDGSHLYVNRPSNALPPRWAAGQSRPVEVPRAPQAGERWDFATGAFILDGEVAADFNAGSAHIARAHAIKAVEAALILSGVRLTHGHIAEEAAATGIPIMDLAASAHAASAQFRARELARRVSKVAARRKAGKVEYGV